MRFRLITLLWAFAVVAASLALLGTSGVLAAVGVLLCWTAIYQWKELALTEIAVTGGIVLIIVALLAPRVETARNAAQANECSGRLSQLGLAIHNYHDVNGHLPPPTFVKGANNDRHSWRVWVIYLFSGQHFMLTYSFDEPWDGPTNSALGGPGVYTCPTHGIDTQASYLAIVGPQAAWREDERRTFDDITDGLDQTILLIDVGRSGIDWKEPKDVTFDEAVELLTSPVAPAANDGHRHAEGWFRKSSPYRNVLMADRSYHRLYAPLPRDLAVALLTADGGEEVDLGALEQYGQPERDYHAIGRAAIFAVVVLLPAVPRVRRNLFPQAIPPQA